MSEIRITIFGEESAGKTALVQRIQKWLMFDTDGTIAEEFVPY